MQAAGHLVAGILAAELAAGVEDGVNNGDSGQAGIRLDIHGDAAAVIRDLNDVVLEDLDLNVVAVTGQRLVDGVVHDLIDQMVQAALAGRADIHARALAHRFQAFQVAVSTLVLVIISSAISFLPFVSDFSNQTENAGASAPRVDNYLYNHFFARMASTPSGRGRSARRFSAAGDSSER